MAGSLIVPGLAAAALVVVASGVMMTRSGPPYSPLVLNVHKLVDLAALVAIGVLVARDAGVAPLSRVAVVAIGVVAALQLVTLVTGGLTSALASQPRSLTWAHRLVSWLALAVTAWWAVLFLA